MILILPDIFEIKDEVKSLIAADRCISTEQTVYFVSLRDATTHLNASAQDTICINLHHGAENN
jgi:hypothetical protein